jgi:hypothetical protein
MSMPRGVVFALVTLLAASGGADRVGAQPRPRCFFLECEGGQRAEPAPAPVPTSPQMPPMQAQTGHASSGTPAPRVLARPTLPGETSARLGALTCCASPVLKPHVRQPAPDRHLRPRPDDRRPARDRLGRGQAGARRGEIGGGRLRRPAAHQGLEIYNGYQRNVDLFERNSRVRDVDVVHSDGTTHRVTFADRSGPQTVGLPREATTYWVQQRIVSPGSRHQNTATTELRILGGR